MYSVYHYIVSRLCKCWQRQRKPRRKAFDWLKTAESNGPSSDGDSEYRPLLDNLMQLGDSGERSTRWGGGGERSTSWGGGGARRTALSSVALPPPPAIIPPYDPLPDVQAFFDAKNRVPTGSFGQSPDSYERSFFTPPFSN